MGDRATVRCLFSRCQDFPRDVTPTGEIYPERLQGVDRAPWDTPPAKYEGNARKPQGSAEGAIARGYEVDIGWTLECHDQQRDAILIDDEPGTALDFLSHLLV